MFDVRYSETAPQGWDDRLRSARGASMLQSTYWARVIEKIDRAKPLFVEVAKDSQTVVCSLLLFQKTPFDRGNASSPPPWKRLLKNSRDWLEWNDGPVFYSAEAREISECTKALMSWVNTWAKDRKLARATGTGPSALAEPIVSEASSEAFRECGYIVDRWATFLFDLSLNAEDLFMKIEHPARKAIKKCLRENIRVEKMKNLEEFRTQFIEPYNKLQRAAGKSGIQDWVADICWNEDRDRYYHYYIARNDKGEFLGTLGMFVFGGVATEVISSVSPTAIEQKIPVQDMIHWQMFLDAKELGCRIFDLAGVNPKPASPKEEGIRRFKEKWAGKYVEYPQIRKSFPNKLDRLRSIFIAEKCGGECR